MTFREEIVTIPTRAGHTLTGTLFKPKTTIGQSLLISSATGMLRRFYSGYSKHFASKGYAVLTFDYWGIGDSGGRLEELRNNTYNLIHWGANDQAAAVRFLKESYPGLSITLVTHSIGGQICGFNREYPLIDRIILIACQSGYWGLYTGLHQLKMWFFWNLMIPWMSLPFGYFPASKLGLFENLPKEMASQWRRWGKHPDYLMGYYDPDHFYFDKINAPVLSLSFPGDDLAPVKAVDWLSNQFTAAELFRVHYSQEGTDPGHFGYFRPQFKETLWRKTHQWIQQKLWHD